MFENIAIEQPASSQIPSLSFCARRFSLSLRFLNRSNCSGCIHRNLRTCMDRESKDQQPACYQGIITQSITHVPCRVAALAHVRMCCFQCFPAWFAQNRLVERDQTLKSSVRLNCCDNSSCWVWRKDSLAKSPPALIINDASLWHCLRFVLTLMRGPSHSINLYFSRPSDIHFE